MDSNKVIKILEQTFSLNDMDKAILKKNSKELNRIDRRYYFETLKVREKEFKKVLREKIHNSSEEERNNLKNMVIDSLLERKGDPTIADGLLMDVIGRLEVYKHLRKRADQEDVKLKALNNFGGIGMVIMLVGVITGIILYLKAIF